MTPFGYITLGLEQDIKRQKLIEELTLKLEELNKKYNELDTKYKELEIEVVYLRQKNNNVNTEKEKSNQES